MIRIYERISPRAYFVLLLLVQAVVGASVMAQSAAPAVSFAERPIGFAAVTAHGLSGTIGGSGGPIVQVRTAQELKTAAERLDVKDKAARQNTPRRICVMNDIDLGELANEQPGKVLLQVGSVRLLPHTTIYAREPNVTLRHGSLEVHGSHNVIIRNLAFRDLWEEDPTGKYDSLGWDFVIITNSGKTYSHHVWVDHCDFGRVYDGMLDITHGSDLVTISWCRFHGEPGVPQKKACLIGHSSSDQAKAMDVGRLNVTFHHNLFADIQDRAPRSRWGNIHFFNNHVRSAENATLSVMNAVTLVENCIYEDVAIATTYSHDSDSVDSQRGGNVAIVGSENRSPRMKKRPKEARDQFEFDHNFQGSVTRDALMFNAPSDFTWDDRNRLPYEYALEPLAGLPEMLLTGTGTRAWQMPE